MAESNLVLTNPQVALLAAAIGRGEFALPAVSLKRAEEYLAWLEEKDSLNG